MARPPSGIEKDSSNYELSTQDSQDLHEMVAFLDAGSLSEVLRRLAPLCLKLVPERATPPLPFEAMPRAREVFADLFPGKPLRSARIFILLKNQERKEIFLPPDSVRQSSREVRLTLSFQPRVLEAFDTLQTRWNLQHKVEVVRTLIALSRHIREAEAATPRFIIKGEDGTEEQILALF